MRKSIKRRTRGFLLATSLCSARIFESVIAVAHRAFHLRDGVAHHAADARPARGRMYSISRWAFEIAGKEQRGIVAACAPFRGLARRSRPACRRCSCDTTVIERRKMVRGALPLFVDVGVAALAGCDSMKIVLGDCFPVMRLRGAGKNGPCGPSPSSSIVAGAIGGIFDAYARCQGTVRTHQAAPAITAQPSRGESCCAAPI